MIQILKDLQSKDLNTFNQVLHQLYIRGSQLNRPYVRYSFLELENVASFLGSHQYDVTVPQSEIDRIISLFNNAETEVYKQIAKRSPEMREGLPDVVRKENHRCRQYVQSLLSGKEERPIKKNGIEELNKLKAILQK